MVSEDEQLEELLSHLRMRSDAIMGNPDRVGLPLLSFIPPFTDGVKKENYGASTPERYKLLLDAMMDALKGLNRKHRIKPHEALAVSSEIFFQALEAYYKQKHPKLFRQRHDEATPVSLVDRRENPTDTYIA